VTSLTAIAKNLAREEHIAFTHGVEIVVGAERRTAMSTWGD
jgi:hypothetical protein